MHIHYLKKGQIGLSKKSNVDIEDVVVTRRPRPILTPEAREDHMINLAVDLAEKQLSDGTAATAVITHYLRLGTEKAKLERIKLEKETLLIAAKADAIDAEQNNESLVQKVMDSMKSYGMT